MFEMIAAPSCRLHILELFSAVAALKTEWRVKQQLQKDELDRALSSLDLAFKNNLPNSIKRIRPRRDIIFSILMLSECLESDT